MWKNLIIFGSKSDQRIYKPLLNSLEKNNFEFEFKIISAHRNPDELEETLKKNKYDLIVTGAGLAAHLPGVCASKCPHLPVIGLPVASMMEGIDSFWSILQMPKGVPVLCAPPDNFLAIISFLKRLASCNSPLIPRIITKNKTLVGSNEEFQKMVSNSPSLQYFNIFLIENEKDLYLLKLNEEYLSIYVPMLKEAQKVFKWVKENQGLWVGVNNITNAIKFTTQITNSLFSKDRPINIGSVKDIYEVKNDNGDYYLFNYTDNFSLFDWGRMPDQLNNKGKALAFMANYFFKELSSHGTAHHSLGLGKKKQQLMVKPVKVIKPKLIKENNKISWDYSVYKSKPSNCLIPLEIIFRFGVVAGSSFLKRLKKDPQYMRELGLLSLPKIDEHFKAPLIEFSTKLEPEDRFVSYKEAQEMASLSDEKFQLLIELVSSNAITLRSIFKEIDLQLWDGKFEMALTRGRLLMFVDSIGPDELRLRYKDLEFSKEFLRKIYRKTPWYENVVLAKERALNSGEVFWKKFVKEDPPRLSPTDKNLAQNLYTTMANALALRKGEKSPFAGPNQIATFYKEYQEYKNL